MHKSALHNQLRLTILETISHKYERRKDDERSPVQRKKMSWTAYMYEWIFQEIDRARQRAREQAKYILFNCYLKEINE